MPRFIATFLLIAILASCGVVGNNMTTERAQKSLLGFTLTDPDFLEYDKGRSMGEVTGIIETSQNKIEILFTVLNVPCDYMCNPEKWRPASNGKATAFVTTDGKWILDCIAYEDYYGNLMLGRQSCNLNRDMDEMSKSTILVNTGSDLNVQKAFTLSERTKQILQSVSQPIEIIGFYNRQDVALQADLESRLKAYRAVSPQITYRFVDPDRDPVTARAENITTYGTVVFKSGEQRQTINTIDEKDITGAILKVIATTKTKVYFVTGHRERSIDTTDATGLGDVKQLLEADNLDVEPLNLVISATIPLENTVVVLADPLDPLQPTEEATIQQYIDQGGRFVLLSNVLSPAPMVNAMTQWGLVWNNDIVIDQQSQIGNPIAPAVLDYPYTEITKDLTGQASVFNSVRTIGTIGTEFPPDYTVYELLKSSENSVAATKFDAGVVETQERDAKGPLTFGYVIETPTEARIVVIGDIDFATNGFLKLSQANAPLFRNIIAWASVQDELISEPTPEPVDRQLFLTESQANIVFYSCVVGLPLLFLGIGIAMWRRR